MAEELNNPLFDDEREFLERKKLEYERALRGDVEHIKEQGVQVGKVALVGAGIAGSVWLISRLLGGKRKKKGKRDKEDAAYSSHDKRQDDYQAEERRNRRFDFDDDEFEPNDEAFGSDPSAEFANGYGYFDNADRSDETDFRDGSPAYESARAFADSGFDNRARDAYYDDEPTAQAERYPAAAEDGEDAEQDFDNGFSPRTHQADRPSRTTHAAADDLPEGRLDFGPAVHLHRNGYESASALAYNDSRRLPSSADFAPEASTAARSAAADHDFALDEDDVDVVVDGTRPASSRAPETPQPTLSKRAGSALKSFLDSDTGRSVAAQATAAALAFITNKVNDQQRPRPTAKNADLAAAPASAPAASAAPTLSTPDDASLTSPDAPTEHPAS